MKTIIFAKMLEILEKSICKMKVCVLYCMGNWKRIQKCKIAGENDHLKV